MKHVFGWGSWSPWRKKHKFKENMQTPYIKVSVSGTPAWTWTGAFLLWDKSANHCPTVQLLLCLTFALQILQDTVTTRTIITVSIPHQSYDTYRTTTYYIANVGVFGDIISFFCVVLMTSPWGGRTIVKRTIRHSCTPPILLILCTTLHWTDNANTHMLTKALGFSPLCHTVCFCLAVFSLHSKQDIYHMSRPAREMENKKGEKPLRL